MKLEEFVTAFANQFDDTDLSAFSPETQFRELEEWSSLVGLAVINMINKKIGVRINPDELRSANTISELFFTVQSKL